MNRKNTRLFFEKIPHEAGDKEEDGFFLYHWPRCEGWSLVLNVLGKSSWIRGRKMIKEFGRVGVPFVDPGAVLGFYDRNGHREPSRIARVLFGSIPERTSVGLRRLKSVAANQDIIAVPVPDAPAEDLLGLIPSVLMKDQRRVFDSLCRKTRAIRQPGWVLVTRDTEKLGRSFNEFEADKSLRLLSPFHLAWVLFAQAAAKASNGHLPFDAVNNRFSWSMGSLEGEKDSEGFAPIVGTLPTGHLCAGRHQKTSSRQDTGFICAVVA